MALKHTAIYSSLFKGACYSKGMKLGKFKSDLFPNTSDSRKHIFSGAVFSNKEGWCPSHKFTC